MMPDGPTRWSKKFSDRFSRFVTIPAVTDSHPATQPRRRSYYAQRLSVERKNWPWRYSATASLNSSFINGFWQRGSLMGLPNKCGRKPWYWSRIICAVSVETVIPLQTAAKYEQIKWSLVKKIVCVFWLKSVLSNICIIKKVMASWQRRSYM